MMNMSVLAALAGMIFVARSAASGPQDGIGWELDAIAAVFIGGAAVSGGLGTISGSIVGGLVMAVLNNGLQLLGVGSDLIQIIKGLVLLLAVAFDVYNKSQGKSSIIGMLMQTFRRSSETSSSSRTRPPPPKRSSSREPDRSPDPDSSILRTPSKERNQAMRMIGKAGKAAASLPSRRWR